MTTHISYPGWNLISDLVPTMHDLRKYGDLNPISFLTNRKHYKQGTDAVALVKFNTNNISVGQFDNHNSRIRGLIQHNIRELERKKKEVGPDLERFFLFDALKGLFIYDSANPKQFVPEDSAFNWSLRPSKITEKSVQILKDKNGKLHRTFSHSSLPIELFLAQLTQRYLIPPEIKPLGIHLLICLVSKEYNIPIGPPKDYEDFIADGLMPIKTESILSPAQIKELMEYRNKVVFKNKIPVEKYDFTVSRILDTGIIPYTHFEKEVHVDLVDLNYIKKITTRAGHLWIYLPEEAYIKNIEELEIVFDSLDSISFVHPSDKGEKNVTIH